MHWSLAVARSLGADNTSDQLIRRWFTGFLVDMCPCDIELRPTASPLASSLVVQNTCEGKELEKTVSPEKRKGLEGNRLLLAVLPLYLGKRHPSPRLHALKMPPPQLSTSSHPPSRPKCCAQCMPKPQPPLLDNSPRISFLDSSARTSRACNVLFCGLGEHALGRLPCEALRSPRMLNLKLTFGVL